MSVGTGTASSAPPRENASDVLVARQVIDEMQAMDPADAARVAVAIKGIGRDREGAPIRLTVPGAPLGVRHYALDVGDQGGHVIIYRSMTLLEPGRWRVTSLMDRASYEQMKEAERSGLLDDDTVRTLLIIGGVIAAAYVLTRAGGTGAG